MTEIVVELPLRDYREAPEDVQAALTPSFAELRGRALAAAADDVGTGAMVALVPSDPAALALDPAVDGAEPAGELHLTLMYLGDAADWDADEVELVRQKMTDVTSRWAPVTGQAFGAAHWNADTDDPAWVLNVGGEVLPAVHEDVERSLYELGIGLAIPEQHVPWVPHVCLAYSADPGLAAAVETRLGPITFDRLRVAFGADVRDVPLSGSLGAGDTSMASHATIRPSGVTEALEEAARRALQQGPQPPRLRLRSDRRGEEG